MFWLPSGVVVIFRVKWRVVVRWWYRQSCQTNNWYPWVQTIYQKKKKTKNNECDTLSNKYTYLKRTMATASFITLSPNTSAYKSTSTCKSWKIANTVTAKDTGGESKHGSNSGVTSEGVKLDLGAISWSTQVYLSY